MAPALQRRQYSSVLTTLQRLCSTSCLLVDFPSTPASTLGLAAASITHSASGNISRSLAIRRSPWKSFTPAALSRVRFVSAPGRARLSTPKISTSLRRSRRDRTKLLPTNPQIPVIRTFIRLGFGLRPQPGCPGRGDLLHNAVERLGDVPCWEMTFDLSQVAVVTDVIARAVLVDVHIPLRLAGDLFGDPEGLPN